jgi:predicted RNA-binding protein with TRAM domain
MKKIISTLFWVFVITAVTFNMAYAKKPWTDLFNNTYGTSGTDRGTTLGSCITCHNQIDGKGGENGYGTDYKNWGRNFIAIENLDSDGDGFINIDEINGGSFPGDPSSTPTPSASPPVADAGPDQTVDEGVTVTLDGSNSSDPDGDISTYFWEQAGGLSVILSDTSAARPTFTAPDVGSGGESLTFQLTVTDSGGLQSTDTSIVNVTWINLPPTADAGPDQAVNEGVTVALDGSNSTDPDFDISSYQWTQTAGTQVTLSSTTAVQPTFTSPNVGPSGASLTFQLRVIDSGGLQSTDTCIVNVSWINLPPTADAGPDQAVNEGDTVTLDSSNSTDPDNGIASYLWTQIGGTPVTLSNTTAVQPTFTAPDVGPSGESLTFQLTVTDSGGLQSTNTCMVDISWVNLSPTADAGPDQAVNEGDAVTLDGSNSTDPDDGVASYLWQQTAGPSVNLSNVSAAQPTFTAPVVGSGGEALTFSLTVTDTFGLGATDICTVNVINGNLPPTADAGPDQTVNEGDTVTLNGSNSTDPDDGIASYQWTQIGGIQVNLSNGAAVQPTFTAPNVGPSGEALTFQLTVTDSGGLQSTASSIVNVSWINLTPTADAGPDQTVAEGVTVTLDGSNSTDPDDGIATYLWTQTAGPPVTLSSTTVFRPSFTAPNVGPSGEALTFQLTVTDSGGLQSTDTCIVNISWINLPPTADAGPDQTVNEGDTVTLDGISSTDPDDGIASYQWTQLAGAQVTLSDSSAAMPTFTAPDVGMNGGSLTFQLTVTDSGGLKSTATNIVNVSWVNEAPWANAGPDQTVEEGATVALDGSNSTDPDDGIATYLWTQTAGPPVTLSDASVAQPTFVTPIVDLSGAALTFRLTAEDIGGLQASSQVSVTINDNSITGFPADVLTMRTLAGEPFGIRENNGGSFTRLSFIDPATMPASSGKPDNLIYGLVEMEVRVSTPGATTTVTIFLPSAAPDGYGWYKYTAATGWIDYNENAVFNAAKDQVTLTLTDGGRGDDDGVVNAVIVDPSGLGTGSSTSSSSSSIATTAGDWGSSGGGCFIATAAYGSLMEPHVQVLRQFRDRFLLTNQLGKAFVRLYYTYSPPLAGYIAKHDGVRAVVRWTLLPLVGFSRVALRLGFGVTLALMLLLLVMLCVTVVVNCRRLRRKNLDLVRQST